MCSFSHIFKTLYPSLEIYKKLKYQLDKKSCHEKKMKNYDEDNNKTLEF
jgi:hypothetical protein